MIKYSLRKFFKIFKKKRLTPCSSPPDNCPWGVKHLYGHRILNFIFRNPFKRQDCCANRYKNVCLVLNDVEIMCTDTDHGFASSNERSNTITWKSVRNGVRKVELVFKQTGDQGHAQIAEMEIIYNNERNDIGKIYVIIYRSL